MTGITNTVDRLNPVLGEMLTQHLGSTRSRTMWAVSLVEVPGRRQKDGQGQVEDWEATFYQGNTKQPQGQADRNQEMQKENL